MTLRIHVNLEVIITSWCQNRLEHVVFIQRWPHDKGVSYMRINCICTSDSSVLCKPQQSKNSIKGGYSGYYRVFCTYFPYLNMWLLRYVTLLQVWQNASVNRYPNTLSADSCPYLCHPSEHLYTRGYYGDELNIVYMLLVDAQQ